MKELTTVTNADMMNMVAHRGSYYEVDTANLNFGPVLDLNLDSKSRFYEKMRDGRLLIPIELEQDKDALEHLITKFNRSLGFTLYNTIDANFSVEEMAENKLSEDKVLEQYKLTLSSGMKFSKALIKMMEKMKYSNAQKEEIANRYSLVLNEKKLVGTLVLSVNPIDFLTMSWSDNWSSCLDAGGEYESGTMSYAIDETSIISFFISERDNENLLANNYVSKKWRKVFVISEDNTSILASRGYPYDGEMLTNITAEHISKLFLDGKELVKYEYEKVFSRVAAFLKQGAPGYSDVGLRNKINVYSSILNLDEEKKGIVKFQFGSDYKCLHCGWDDAHAEGYACTSCGNYECCENCGDAIPHDTGYYTSYGYMVCDDCGNTDYAFADDDDEMYRIADLVYIESEDSYVTEYYAERNYFECNSCDEQKHIRELHELDDESCVCRSCLSEIIENKTKEEGEIL